MPQPDDAGGVGGVADMSDYESDRRLHAVMVRAGWAYDDKTHGFRKGEDWVTWGQAEAALAAAETGEGQVITPASESVAEFLSEMERGNEQN